MQRLLAPVRFLLVVAIVSLAASTAPVRAEPPVLSAPEAFALLDTGALVLLDIRRPEEWAETGLAKGAWPVSMHTREFPQQLQAILSQYRPDEIALICATGGRTSYVSNILERNGVTGVVDLSEGMFGNGAGPGWLARGLPLVSVEEATADFEAAKRAWE